MSTPINLQRHYDTEANLYSDLRNLQIGIKSDDNKDLVWKVGSNYYHAAAYKYYDGASDNYLDTTFNAVYSNTTISCTSVIYKDETLTSISFSGGTSAKIGAFIGGVELQTWNGNGVGVYQTYPNSIFHIGASISIAVTSTSANILLSDLHHSVRVDTSSGNVTVSLPDSRSITGRWYKIRKSHDSNAVIISATLGQTVEGQNIYHLITGGSAFEIAALSSNWVQV